LGAKSFIFENLDTHWLNVQYQKDWFKVTKQDLDVNSAIIEFDGMQGYPCSSNFKKAKTTFISPFSVSLTIRETANGPLKRYYWVGVPKNQPKNTFAFLLWLKQVFKFEDFQHLLGERKTIIVPKIFTY
tara:strand:+ start:2366 stop:2752 length:387 start_codon:yes stop_codon:yes gene_type:complete